MTPSQRGALTSVVGRALTDTEVLAISPLLDPNNRNDTAIAAILSAGRTRYLPTQIGVGTILSTLRGVGAGGGVFLDTLMAIGEVDRDIHWTMKLIEAGALRIDLPEVREGMQQLAIAAPTVAAGIEALLALSAMPDPLDVASVSAALNIAEGRVNL